MRRASLGDLIIIGILVTLVGGLLAPVIAQARRTQAEAKCQSNLRRLGEAMALYLSDNQGTYPKNLTANVQLSSSGTDSNGYPIRFENGVNWVEGIQNYVFDAARSTGHWAGLALALSMP